MDSALAKPSMNEAKKNYAMTEKRLPNFRVEGGVTDPEITDTVSCLATDNL